MKEINKLRPFTKFCMSIGMIPSSYKASLTYEEQLMWLCDYLENTVIPAVNNNGEAVTELQELYIELKNYVDNYFTNLDVQKEIDNKLDQMAEDGTLENIINQEIFSELNNKVDNVINSTLYNVVDNMPENLINNSEYAVINYKENLNIDIPKSNYQLLKEAQKLSNENLNNNIFRIATFNIGNEDVPYNINVKGLYKYAKLRRIFNALKCNVINCQELLQYLQLPLNEFLTTDFYKYHNFGTAIENIKPLQNYGNGYFSNIEQQYFEAIPYHSQITERRIYTKTLYSYNNKIISIFNTHIQQGVAQDQINELFTAVQNDTSPYKIITGDFNINILNNGSTYFSSFLQAGFKQVNAGKYFDAHGTTNAPFSEILVSSNINIESSEMFTDENVENIRGAHYPIIANLSFKEV